MKVVQLEGALATKVEIFLKDNKGNIVFHSVDKNADTVWAKLHAPTGTLYFDFITVPLDTVLGDAPREGVLTAVNKVEELRSYIFSSQAFSYNDSSKEYTYSFSYGNSTNETIRIYGLMSFYRSGNYTYLYTVYIPHNPIEVKPGYAFGGTYKIKISATTPTFSSTSETSQEINTNDILTDLPQGTVHKGLREYKYSRYATKSDVYLGINPSDSVSSFVELSQCVSNDADSKLWNKCTVGELYYKGLLSGGLGAAKVVRFLQVYDRKDVHSSETGLFYYSFGSASNTVTPVTCAVKKVDEVRVRPWKFKFSFDSSAVTTYSSRYQGQHYPQIFFADRLVGSNKNYYYFVAYWYWPDSPTLKVVTNSYTTLSSVYINGVSHSVSRSYSNGWYVYTVNTSGLSAGEGIILMKFNLESETSTYNHNVFYITGDFYGYAVPFAGFLEKDSSEIVSNWVNSHFFSYQGTNTKAADVYDVDPNTLASSIGLVSNFPLSKLRDKVGAEHCFWVWVKESEFDKLAGTVGDGLVASLVNSTNYRYYASSSVSTSHMSCAVPQLFGYADNAFIFNVALLEPVRFHPYASILSQGVIYDILFAESVNCDSYKIDYGSREFEMKDGYLLYCAVPESLSTNPSSPGKITERFLIGRKQGEDNYSKLIPESLVNYTEGASVVEFNGQVYEVETTLQQNEKVLNLNLAFSSDTVFVAGEYFSVPVNDAETVLLTDKLEKWKVYTIDNIQTTEITVAPVLGCYGMDRVADPEDPLSYVEIQEPIEVEAPVPTEQIRFTETATHYFTYSVTVHVGAQSSIRDKLKHILLLPKKFTLNGETYYTNCDTFTVTDGMRIIPSSLVTNSEVFTGELEADERVMKEYWLIGINNYTLFELFQPGDPDYAEPITATLFVYVEAKRKDDILPLDIDLYTYYLKPFGKNDTFTRVYLIEKQDKSIGKYGYPVQVDFHDVDLDGSDFNSMSLNGTSSYVEVQGFNVNSSVQYKEGYLLPSYYGLGTWSIDFYFKPIEYPSDESYTQIILDTRSQSSGSVTGLVVALRENGCIQVAYPNGRSTSDQNAGSKQYTDDDVYIQSFKIATDEWHYMVINFDKGAVTVFLDGICIGSFNVPWNHSMSNLVLGSRYDKGSNFFHGKFRWFHLSTILRWLNEHTPPPINSNWDEVDNWNSNIAVQQGTAVFKAVLPYALDSNIDVVDENGQHVDFALLTNVYTDATEDFLGNYLYIKCPAVEYSEGREFVAYSQFPTQMYRYKLNSFLHLTSRSIMRLNSSPVSMSSLLGTGISHTAYMQFGWVLRNDLDSLEKQFVHSPYDVSPAVEPILKLPKPKIYKFKVIGSTEAKGTQAKDFFPLYFNPPDTTHASGVMVSNQDWITDTLVYVNGGAVVSNPNAPYNTTEFIVQNCSFKPGVENEGTAGSVNLKDRKGKTVNSSVGIYTTDEGIPTVTYYTPKSHSYLKFFSGTFGRVIGYRALLSSTNTHQYLTTGSAEYIEHSEDRYPVFELPVTDPVEINPQVDVLTVTGSDASRDIAVWKVGSSYKGKLITYTVTNLQALHQCYTNWLGTHPLSVYDRDLFFSVVFTQHSKDVWQFNPHYVFTQDPDVVSAFRSGLLQFSGVTVGYVPDTESRTLPPDTEFTSSSTNSIVLKLRAVTNVYSIPNQIISDTRYESSKGYTVWNSPSRLREHYCNPLKRTTEILPLVTHMWDGHLQVATRNYAERYNAEAKSIQSEFQSYPLLYYSDLNTIVCSHDCMKVDFPPPGLLTSPQTVASGGQIGHYASYCDARMFAKTNIEYNVLWDPQVHAIDKVESFGHFTVVGVTDVSALDIFPIIKLSNSDSGEVKYFMAERHRLVPKEVPEEYFTDDKLRLNRFRRMIKSLYSNLPTFQMFDSLIPEFAGGNWNFQYGWLVIHTPSDERLSRFCVIRSISVMPSFNDVNEYHTVPYCYWNEKADIYTTSAMQITPTTDYTVKVYNTADQAQANIPVRISLDEINLDNYTQGIVAQLGSSPLPTIYELEEGYLTNDWDDFLDRGTGNIYVKIPVIEAKQTLEITLNNGVNTYTPNQVFEKYYEFGTNTDYTDWKFVGDAPAYSGTVQDVDAGPGMTSTSDRLVHIPSLEFIRVNNCTYIQSENMIFAKYEEAHQQDKLYELGYTADENVYVALYLSSATPTLDEELVEVPHYTYPDDTNVGSVAVRLPGNSYSYTLHVYYDTSSDLSDEDAVFYTEPVFWFNDIDIVEDIRYEIQSGSFTVDGDTYNHRVIVQLTLNQFFEGDRVIHLPIQKWVGTKNFKVYRRKTAYDYFSAAVVFNLRSSFVASRLPSPVSEFVDRSKDVISLTRNIDYNYDFPVSICVLCDTQPYGLYFNVYSKTESTNRGWYFNPGDYYKVNVDYMNPEGTYKSYSYVCTHSVAPSGGVLNINSVQDCTYIIACHKYYRAGFERYTRCSEYPLNGKHYTHLDLLQLDSMCDVQSHIIYGNSFSYMFRLTFPFSEALTEYHYNRYYTTVTTPLTTQLFGTILNPVENFYAHPACTTLSTAGWKVIAESVTHSEDTSALYFAFLPLILFSRRKMSTVSASKLLSQTNTIDGFTYSNFTKVQVCSVGKFNKTGFILSHIRYRGGYLNAAIEKVQTHNSDYIFPAPNLETPILGFSVDNTSTQVIFRSTSVANWVVDEWRRKYTDIKLETTDTLYLHIAASTGKRKKFCLKWFRVSPKPVAPIVQLMKKDLKILIPNIHTTWYAFVKGEDPVLSVDDVKNHIEEVRKRNKSLDIEPIQPLMSAVEQCRGIGTRWLPPRWTIFHPVYYVNT